MKRFLVLLVASAVLSSVFAMFGSEPALACSCIGTDLAVLDGVSGAVTGTVTAVTELEVDPDGYDQHYVATVQVDRDLKDNVDDVVHVETYKDDGGNCGITWSVGDEIAASLYDDGGVLRTDGCSWVQPVLFDLWEPPVNRAGTAEVVVSSWSQGYRIAAYDAAGEPIAFGFEVGHVEQIGVCDDNNAIIELVRTGQNGQGDPILAVRNLADFVVASELSLQTDDGTLIVEQMTCSGPTDNPTITAFARVGNLAGASNSVWLHEGADSGWQMVEASEQPKTRGTRVEADWPETTTSRGIAIAWREPFNMMIELPAPVDVDAATGEYESAQLGSGVAAQDAQPTAAPVPVDAEPAPPATEDPNRPPVDVASAPDPTNTDDSGGLGPVPIALIGIAAVLGALGLAAVFRRRPSI